jgi:hypothetical protein
MPFVDFGATGFGLSVFYVNQSWQRWTAQFLTPGPRGYLRFNQIYFPGGNDAGQKFDRAVNTALDTWRQTCGPVITEWKYVRQERQYWRGI